MRTTRERTREILVEKCVEETEFLVWSQRIPEKGLGLGLGLHHPCSK